NGRTDREWAQAVDRLRCALAEHIHRHRAASNGERAEVEALREAETWLRAISDWLLANDYDMSLPSGVLDTDPLDIADKLRALSATPAQEVDETERLRDALREIDKWCCPVFCTNCADNREIARAALAPEGDAR